MLSNKERLSEQNETGHRAYETVTNIMIMIMHCLSYKLKTYRI